LVTKRQENMISNSIGEHEEGHIFKITKVTSKVLLRYN
jgi:hypothetical protein